MRHRGWGDFSQGDRCATYGARIGIALLSPGFTRGYFRFVPPGREAVE